MSSGSKVHDVFVLFWKGTGPRIQLEYKRCSLVHGVLTEILQIDNVYTKRFYGRGTILSEEIDDSGRLVWFIHYAMVDKQYRVTCLYDLQKSSQDIAYVLVYCTYARYHGDARGISEVVDLRDCSASVRSVLSKLDPDGLLRYVPAMYTTPQTVEESAIAAGLNSLSDTDRQLAIDSVRAKHAKICDGEFAVRYIANTELRREIVCFNPESRRVYKELLPDDD